MYNHGLPLDSIIRPYGQIDVRDLHVGDHMGLFTSEDGVLEFIVNGEIKA